MKKKELETSKAGTAWKQLQICAISAASGPLGFTKSTATKHWKELEMLRSGSPRSRILQPDSSPSSSLTNLCH
jgi:hypothetical protein